MLLLFFLSFFLSQIHLNVSGVQMSFGQVQKMIIVYPKKWNFYLMKIRWEFL